MPRYIIDLILHEERVPVTKMTLRNLVLLSKNIGCNSNLLFNFLPISISYNISWLGCCCSDVIIFLLKRGCSSSDIIIFPLKRGCSSSDIILFPLKRGCSSSDIIIFPLKRGCSSSDIIIFPLKRGCSSSDIIIFLQKRGCPSSDVNSCLIKLLLYLIQNHDQCAIKTTNSINISYLVTLFHDLVSLVYTAVNSFKPNWNKSHIPQS